MTQQLQKVSGKQTIADLLKDDNFIEGMGKVASSVMTPEKVINLALIAASRQPRLMQCTKASLVQSMIKAAELGLDCSGTLGKAYLIPYYNSKISAYECQFMPGYQGLIELARRSGEIAKIEARVVYEHDEFDLVYGIDTQITHRPNFDKPRTDDTIKGFYMVAKTKSGDQYVEYMTKAEVDSIRARSKAKDFGPWVTDYSEMGRKTVVRRGSKYLPLSTEFASAIAEDDKTFETPDMIKERTKSNIEEFRSRINESRDTKGIEAVAEAAHEDSIDYKAETEEATGRMLKHKATRKAAEKKTKQKKEPETEPSAESILDFTDEELLEEIDASCQDLALSTENFVADESKERFGKVKKLEELAREEAEQLYSVLVDRVAAQKEEG